MDGALVIDLGGHSLSIEKRQQIIDLHNQGLSKTEIARRVVTTRETVYRWIGRWERGEGLQGQHGGMPKTSPETIERMCEMRRAGMRSGQIAKEVGLHPVTVTKLLTEQGLGLYRG